jgi:hypothetical protein
MSSGEKDLMGIAASGAQRTQAMSAPHRSEAIAAKYGAPQYSKLPPITTTLPAPKASLELQPGSATPVVATRTI